MKKTLSILAIAAGLAAMSLSAHADAIVERVIWAPVKAEEAPAGEASTSSTPSAPVTGLIYAPVKTEEAPAAAESAPAVNNTAVIYAPVNSDGTAAASESAAPAGIVPGLIIAPGLHVPGYN
jgi:hypothetical protein